MDVQAHALHLGEVAHQALAGVAGQADVNFIQRVAAHPFHKILEPGLDGDPLHQGTDVLLFGVHQRHADDVFAPVPVQVPHQRLHPVPGGEDPHQLFHGERMAAAQIGAQNPPGRRGDGRVDKKNPQIQIPGIRHRRLGDDEQNGQGGGKDGVVFHHPQQFRFHIPPDKVHLLVEAAERNEESHRQHGVKLHIVRYGIGGDEPQNGAEQQLDQHRADGQRQQVHAEGQHILKLLTISHEYNS